jgi:hypothetical protein
MLPILAYAKMIRAVVETLEITSACPSLPNLDR